MEDHNRTHSCGAGEKEEKGVDETQYEKQGKREGPPQQQITSRKRSYNLQPQLQASTWRRKKPARSRGNLASGDRSCGRVHSSEKKEGDLTGARIENPKHTRREA